MNRIYSQFRLDGRVISCTRTGGVIPTPAEVRAKIMEAAQEGGAE